MLYLQTASPDCDQRKEMESLLAPSQNFRRHFLEQLGLLHLLQKDKIFGALRPQKRQLPPK